jgi:hypothetical protein
MTQANSIGTTKWVELTRTWNIASYLQACFARPAIVICVPSQQKGAMATGRTHPQFSLRTMSLTGDESRELSDLLKSGEAKHPGSPVRIKTVGPDFLR